MQGHRRAVSRRISGLLTCTALLAIALTVLFAAPDARAQGVQQNAAPVSDNPFSRWFGSLTTTTPAAAPAPVVTAPAPQRVRKRIAKPRKYTRPAVAQTAPARAAHAQVTSAEPMQETPAQEQAAAVQPQSAEQEWPSAADNLGAPMIVPLTIKTVREMLEPEPQLVSDNEVSDIDRAAEPARASASSRVHLASAVTDGSGMIDSDATEHSRVFAMGETMKAVLQSGWVEPLLLMFAGAFAGFTAIRVFA